MKKLGFTLSEVIIALGIVGVIAAMTAPLISGIMPDKSKVAVLNLYKTLSDINQEMLSDPGLYMTDGTCTGLRCDQQSTKPPYNVETYSGGTKYPQLLAQHLKCTQNLIGDNGLGSIILPDGTDLHFSSHTSSPVRRTYCFYVDINPSGKNCTYDKTKCKNPDRFKFKVENNGTIAGDDPLTKAYLANPYKLNDRKKDLKSAGG